MITGFSEVTPRPLRSSRILAIKKLLFPLLNSYSRTTTLIGLSIAKIDEAGPMKFELVNAFAGASNRTLDENLALGF